MQKKQRVNLTLDKHSYKMLHLIAVDRKKSLSHIVRELIKEKVNQDERLKELAEVLSR